MADLSLKEQLSSAAMLPANTVMQAVRGWAIKNVWAALSG